MGLIPKTGRKAWKVRLLHGGIFAVLTLGAATMVVPFLLMLTGATRTGVDQHEFRLTPRFLGNDTALFRKHIEALYNESPAALRAAWRVDHADFSTLHKLDETDTEHVHAWRAFVADHGGVTFPGYTLTPVSRSRGRNVRGFIWELKSRFGNNIEATNTALETDFRDWNAVTVLAPDPRARLGRVEDSPWWRAWNAYINDTAPEWSLAYIDLTGFFHERVWIPPRGREADRPALTRTAPEDGEVLEAWTLFVREIVHPQFVRIGAGAQAEWQAFLAARYVDLPTFRRITGLNADDWSDVTLPAAWAESGPLLPDWEAFLQGWQDAEGLIHRAPVAALSLESADLAWREETGTAPPIRESDQLRFEEHRAAIRRTFLFQHLGTVWEILILDGRGLGNTVFYCAMAVLLALIVNPLAAYALSRFRPPNAYALLLFLLLTMAFPPMVTQIPVFLMLRDFGLLNTFWALLLPGMAHGYSIFLLKGFFDSLPRDLYESAALDGAGELRMFWMITFSLSKPILAVIALSAFVNAYTNFMFALLICQDESMWTLMVWLYQLQQSYGPGVMNAAFVLAALPTLFVFLLAQNQIMRGIVIPVEK
jgi:multiple sugar transport system permease protein